MEPEKKLMLKVAKEKLKRKGYDPRVPFFGAARLDIEEKKFESQGNRKQSLNAKTYVERSFCCATMQ